MVHYVFLNHSLTHSLTGQTMMRLFACLLARRIRTSYGTFLSRGQDEVVRKIEERIAAFAMVPIGQYCLLVSPTNQRSKKEVLMALFYEDFK
jgi:hypothetical protein